MEKYHKVASIFDYRYPVEPLITISPGRVNLIGEHTDYNEGYVLPAAIDKVINFAIAPSQSDWCEIYALDMDEIYRFDITKYPFTKSERGWPDYILGCVDELIAAGYEVPGFNCVFGGDIPIGAGLSSSAALECGILYALSEQFDLGLSRLDIVKLGQRAENRFVGVQCGIMDQFASVFGKSGHVFRLDCRTLQHTYFPADFEGKKILLCDTMISWALADSEYNKRRSQCEEGVRVLQKYDPDIQSLRDVTLDLLENHKDEIDPVVYSRCEYVVEENARVLKACNALDDSNFRKLGRLMFASHDGLRYKYEVSCDELDVLVNAAREMDGVYGARMMGAGFGGCTINLVDEEDLNRFEYHIKQEYSRQFDRSVKFYVSTIEQGVHVVQQTVVEI